MKGRSAGGRLVLRNLPFTTTIPDLYALFSPFGLIHSVDLPTDDKGKARGFGFVWFFKKDDAQKAMGKLNGVVVHGARSEWSDRIKRGGEAKKQTRLRKKREEFFNEKEQNGEEAVATTTTTAVGRAMAVDWAISKDKFEASEQKVEEKEEEATQDDADEEDEEDEDEEEDDDDDEEGTPVPADLERDESDDDESVEEDPKTDDFPTLFIRNIQFESTSADLHAL